MSVDFTMANILIKVPSPKESGLGISYLDNISKVGAVNISFKYGLSKNKAFHLININKIIFE